MGFKTFLQCIYFLLYSNTSLTMMKYFLAIRALASKLVEQWLKTVKGEQVIPVQIAELTKIINEASNDINADIAIKPENSDKKLSENDEYKVLDVPNEQTDCNDTITEKDVADTKIEDNDKVPVLKISLKDGKQVLSQVDDNETKNSEGSHGDIKERHKSKSKDKSKERSSSSSKSSSSSSKHSSKRHSSSSSSDKNKSSPKSSSSSRHSSREGSKDKHSSSKSKSDSRSSKSSDRSSSSSSKSREERRSSSDKDKSKERGKDEKTKENLQKTSTDDKASPPSIHKLGKIPKLSDLKKDKLSISIEVRKPDEPKPKTVKTFHSKFRKHGLEEEIKPPPSRAAVLNKKPPPIVPPPSVPIPKRPSPVHNETPPEKKIKIIEPVEKPGAIKLIPPKPKRKYSPLFIILDLFLTCCIFSGPNWCQLLECSSHNSSLGCVFDIGKSNKYTSSKVLHSLVKCLWQINAQFHMNLSVKILTLIFGRLT